MYSNIDTSTPNKILRHFVDLRNRGIDRFNSSTFIVLGRTGPTGKTWLCTALKDHGFNALELNEAAAIHVDYIDDKNSVYIGYDQVVIILNKPLHRD